MGLRDNNKKISKPQNNQKSKPCHTSKTLSIKNKMRKSKVKHKKQSEKKTQPWKLQQPWKKSRTLKAAWKFFLFPKIQAQRRRKWLRLPLFVQENPQLNSSEPDPWASMVAGEICSLNRRCPSPLPVHLQPKGGHEGFAFLLLSLHGQPSYHFF